MAIRPSIPEVITVNSEALQTQIRDLLPSQAGFGSELQATNVIVPIIDLTAAAEGSGLPISLQNALAFGSQTAFNTINTTTTLASSPGFYRVTGTISISRASNDRFGQFDMTDGLSTKTVYQLGLDGGGTALGISVPVDLIFWLDAGITLTAKSDGPTTIVAGSIRQVADSTGTLVNPSGFPL